MVNGKIEHHITTEVDCESLFSMSGYKLEPRRLNTDTDTYESRVIASHYMHCIHIYNQEILDTYCTQQLKFWEKVVTSSALLYKHVHMLIGGGSTLEPSNT